MRFKNNRCIFRKLIMLKLKKKCVLCGSPGHWLIGCNRDKKSKK